jgi:5-methylcytosine-specific restriction endonuclease McrA
VPSREKRAEKRAAAAGYDGANFSLAEWETLLGACGHRCLRCGVTEGLSVDHVIPLSCGGVNTVENLQPLCRECNSLKGSEIRDYRPREEMHA